MRNQVLRRGATAVELSSGPAKLSLAEVEAAEDRLAAAIAAADVAGIPATSDAMREAADLVILLKRRHQVLDHFGPILRDLRQHVALRYRAGIRKCLADAQSANLENSAPIVEHARRVLASLEQAEEARRKRKEAADSGKKAALHELAHLLSTKEKDLLEEAMQVCVEEGVSTSHPVMIKARKRVAALAKAAEIRDKRRQLLLGLVLRGDVEGVKKSLVNREWHIHDPIGVHGETCILMAVIKPAGPETLLHMVSTLLGCRANPNDMSAEGRPPLLYVQPDCPAVAKTLIEHLADPNKQDQDGEGLLHRGCRLHCPQLAELALRYGANVFLKNLSGFTALEYVETTLEGCEDDDSSGWVQDLRTIHTSLNLRHRQQIEQEEARLAALAAEDASASDSWD